jgi:hypothetical protein
MDQTQEMISPLPRLKSRPAYQAASPGKYHTRSVQFQPREQGGRGKQHLQPTDPTSARHGTRPRAAAKQRHVNKPQLSLEPSLVNTACSELCRDG